MCRSAGVLSNEPICKRLYKRGKEVPGMALSNDDGCVIARSYDAKPFIKTGEPYLQIQHTLKPHGIVQNYAVYGDM
eukprot:gene14642-18707_t